MTSLHDDTRAMARAVEEPEAFAEVYGRHVGPIVHYLRRRLGDVAAEDAANKVFMQAFARRDSYVPVHPTALPWLYGIASRVIADHHRHEQRRLSALARLATETVADDDAPAASALPGDLVHALRALPQADRETLLLIVLGELTYEETATALGVPVGTVRSRVARARARLKQQIPPRPLATAHKTGELHA